jgi:hypothetical protein
MVLEARASWIIGTELIRRHGIHIAPFAKSCAARAMIAADVSRKGLRNREPTGVLCSKSRPAAFSEVMTPHSCP